MEVRTALESRDQLLKGIRSWFLDTGFIEVETPIVLSTPCMEDHIDALGCGDRFLRTSPELYHKRILAEGMEKIYEIGRCFRAEELGRLHHPEYTMLEWYRLDATYKDMMRDTQSLITQLAHHFSIEPPSFHIFRVKDLFIELTDWNPLQSFDADRFDEVICEQVEPYFAALGGASFLLDYPKEVAALARCVGTKEMYAERWELYIKGVEMANAYSELTDPQEQRTRFEQCADNRASRNKEIYPIDEAFLDALPRISTAGGTALGIDRLLLWLDDKDTLDDVLPFREVWK